MVDFSFIGEIINNTSIYGVTWIIPTLFTALTVIAITRDSEEMKSLAFPIMYGYHTIGVTQNVVFMVLAGIVFVQEGLSINIAGTAVSAVKQVGSVAQRAKMATLQREGIADKFEEASVLKHTRRQELADKVLLGPKERQFKKLDLQKKIKDLKNPKKEFDADSFIEDRAINRAFEKKGSFPQAPVKEIKLDTNPMISSADDLVRRFYEKGPRSIKEAIHMSNYDKRRYWDEQFEKLMKQRKR